VAAQRFPGGVAQRTVVSAGIFVIVMFVGRAAHMMVVLLLVVRAWVLECAPKGAPLGGKAGWVGLRRPGSEAPC